MALWEQWLKQKNEKAKPPEVPKPTKEPVVYRYITDTEAKAVIMLNGCVFLPGSYTKRFVRNMQGAAKLTEKQAAYLRQTFYRYRRQLKLTDEQAKTFFDDIQQA